MPTKSFFFSPRRIFLFPVVSISILLLMDCSSKSEKDVSDSTAYATDAMPVNESSEPDYEENPEPGIDFIHYWGTKEDNIRESLGTFSPFVPVQTLARQYISRQDSLEQLRQLYGEPLTDPADTLMLQPLKEKAYQAILNYKKQMATGTSLRSRCPTLLELNRLSEADDSSLNLLPNVAPSNLLSQGNFFFIGGAPFIKKLEPKDNSIFTDPQNKPETRFGTTITENASYLFTSVCHFKKGPIDIEYGPPLGSYEMGPQEVHGIGSLTHRFVQRIPVFFITESGLVTGHLISVRLKIFAEELGCVSDQPYIQFACAQALDANDILGVYIPFGASSIASCTVNRLSENVWTADINNDSTADIACVTEVHAGEISDTIAESMWFVNINGTWKIIDWGRDLECT